MMITICPWAHVDNNLSTVYSTWQIQQCTNLPLEGVYKDCQQMPLPSCRSMAHHSMQVLQWMMPLRWEWCRYCSHSHQQHKSQNFVHHCQLPIHRWTLFLLDPRRSSSKTLSFNKVLDSNLLKQHCFETPFAVQFQVLALSFHHPWVPSYCCRYEYNCSDGSEHQPLVYQ